MMSVCFSDDELFTLGAALELAMTTCERDKEYGLADRFAELYKRVDEAVRGDGTKEGEYGKEKTIAKED